MRRIPWGLLLLTSGLNAVAFADSHYKLTNTVSISGDSGWDYLTADSDNRRLYIAHGSKVDVVDMDSLASVGTISGTPGVHGVAIAGPNGRGYISLAKTDSVILFNLRSLKKTAEIPTQHNPDAILFDPSSSRVYVFNNQSNSATVIDVQKEEDITTIALPGKPEFAVADGSGRIYVDIVDQNKLALIDSRGMKVDKTFSLPGCEEPTSLALDPSHRRLFVGCGNRVMAAVDADTGRVITTLPIGERVDATVFDAEGALIFNSSVDGTLTVIKEDSPDKYHVVETVRTQNGARTMALDTKTHRLFLVTAEFGPPPPPTPDRPKPRASIVPGSFKLLVVGK